MRKQEPWDISRKVTNLLIIGGLLKTNLMENLIEHGLKTLVLFILFKKITLAALLRTVLKYFLDSARWSNFEKKKSSENDLGVVKQSKWNLFVGILSKLYGSVANFKAQLSPCPILSHLRMIFHWFGMITTILEKQNISVRLNFNYKKDRRNEF